MAKKKGEEAEHHYYDRGYNVYFEFVGILEIVDIRYEPKDEVWWQFKEMVTPMERRDQLIPPENELFAVRAISSRKLGRRKVP
jgi:hypothetical protein